MFENRQGLRIPEVTFRARAAGQWQDISTAEVFANKTVVVFALPGAFTPTCSSAHVPRYHELAPLMKARGVDEIVCISVNDGFVMEAWQRDQGADRIRFLPDGNGDFTRQMGMLVDKQALGFGPRSWRYSMLVRDGVIDTMFIEPDEPGDPFKVSDADTMLDHLDPQAPRPSDIVLFTKAGCPHCARAEQLLRDRGRDFRSIPAELSVLRAVSGRATTPQVFIDGQHIGGADELAQHLG
ncbi:MAG: glutathione peroxidase [Deltaproteobacteria bacterium]|nr:glutathione peroxidase [Deltaproteobacteria bacterium]